MELLKKKKTKVMLGKNTAKQSVGILLKNIHTKSLVQNAQETLSKKSLHEVKEYLKEHNLIKVGTSAPTDVLRKMYESAMLAGEITNSNKDNLLHNYIADSTIH